MIQKLLLYIFLLAFISNSSAQTLTLADLTNICNKANWQDVNQVMLAKGWTYYDSAKGDTENNKYSVVTWSYKKDNDSDKSKGWFYFYTLDGFPNKVAYSVFNKPSYLLIQNSLTANGFKFVDSEIEDEKVISSYGSLGYTLKISNAKRNDDSDGSFVSYSIVLSKKPKTIDNENGKKVEYYENGAINMEYNLVNGKLNGLVKVYYENGNPKKIRNYINGIASGKFVEFGENGEKAMEYMMNNDAENGLLTYYKNNKVSYTVNYKDGKKQGVFTGYDYNNDGQLYLKTYGQFVNNEQTGLWKTFYIDGKNEKLFEFTNYLNGIKNGNFQTIQNDSLTTGSYKNNELDGIYKVYIDLNTRLLGNLISTDFTKLTLITEGQYLQGEKTGNWRNYDISKSLTDEGNYSQNLKYGEWKYYYPNYVKKDGGREQYAKELYLIENYSEGKLNGTSTRFSRLEVEAYPCDEVDNKGNRIDTCKRLIYVKSSEYSNYVNDELNGNYELRNSDGEVITKGFYVDGKSNGLFIEKNVRKNIKNTYINVTEEGNYKNGEKNGRWVETNNKNKLVRTINYNNGIFDGEYIEYNENEKPEFVIKYEYGYVKQLVINGNKGISKTDQFDVLQTTESYLKCVRTTYFQNLITSQEFWIRNDNAKDFNCLVDFLQKTNNETPENLGYKDGEYVLSAINGQVLQRGKCFKTNKIELWAYYFYDQNVKLEVKYTDNVNVGEEYTNLQGASFTGEFEYIDVEKNIKEVRKIKEGLRNGKTSILDLKTQKTIKKEMYKDGKLKE